MLDAKPPDDTFKPAPKPVPVGRPQSAQPLATGIRRRRARNKGDPQSLFANCSNGNAISR